MKTSNTGSGSALRGAGYLVVLQAASRILTFLLNLAIARRVAPGVYGLAIVALTTLHDLILTIAREPVRRAARRVDLTKAAGMQRLANLGWVAVVIGLVVAPAITVLALLAAPTESQLQDAGVEGGWIVYLFAAVSFALAGVLEASAAPAYVLVENLLLIHIRVRVEAVAFTVRCVVAAVLVLCFDAGLVAFAAAHLVHGVAVLIGWLRAVWNELPFVDAVAYAVARAHGKTVPMVVSGHDVALALMPHRFVSESTASAKPLWLDPELRADLSHYVMLELEKLFLAEGEKVALIVLGVSATVQGEYGLVSNLSCLVVRLLFLPIEEVSSTLFARLVVMGSFEELSTQFSLMLKLQSTVGLLAATLGPVHSFAVVHVLYSAKWSIETDVPRVLAWHCVYVLLLAANGILEGFLQAAASAPQIRHYNLALVVFVVVHVIAVGCAVRFECGGVGLVAAGCCSMIARIIYSSHFVYRFFENISVSRGAQVLVSALPGSPLATTLLVAATVSKVSGSWWGVLWAPTDGVVKPLSLAAHICTGAIMFAIILAVGWRTEQQFLRWVRTALADGRKRD